MEFEGATIATRRNTLPAPLLPKFAKGTPQITANKHLGVGLEVRALRGYDGVGKSRACPGDAFGEAEDPTSIVQIRFVGNSINQKQISLVQPLGRVEFKGFE